MITFLYVLYVTVCVFLIFVVLLQAGKGGMGTAFGGGSQTVFGGSGAGNFLTRLTVISAALFMLLSATLTYVSSSGEQSLERAAAKIRTREEARSSAPAGTKTKGEKAGATGAQSSAESSPAAPADPGAAPVVIQHADGTPVELGDTNSGAPIQVQRVDGIGGKPIDVQAADNAAEQAPQPDQPVAPAE